MKQIFLILISILFTILADAQVIYVPSQFQSIQSAIDASSEGDSIEVAPGIYAENLVFSHGLVLYSKFLNSGEKSDIDSTIIDGMDSGSVILAVGLTDERIELVGFTIQNGSGTLHDADIFQDTMFYFGGGIHVRELGTLVLDNLVIKDNVAAGDHSSGGGVFADKSEVIISNCEIHSNEVSGGSFLGQGAGMAFYNSEVTIFESSIHHNLGIHGYAEGGGIYGEYSKINIIDSEIRENESPNSAAMQFANSDVYIHSCDVVSNVGSFTTVMSVIGHQSDTFDLHIFDSRFRENQANQSAIFGFNGVDVRIHRSQFTDNHMGFGAGCIALTSSKIDIKDVDLHDNISDHHSLSTNGGALKVYNSSGVLTNIRMTGNGRNNVTDFCYGGALHVTNSTLVMDSLLIGQNQCKRGGGIYAGSSNLLLRNSLIHGNISEVGGAVRSYGSSWRIEKSTITDNLTIDGAGITSQYDTFQLVNSILWNEDGPEIGIHPNSQDNSLIDIAYSNIRGLEANMVNLAQADLTWHDGIKDELPQFSDPLNVDYSLLPTSPLIDAGTSFFEHNGETWVNLNSGQYTGAAPDIGFNEHSGISAVEEHTADAFHVFPNPARDQVWLAINEGEIDKFSIFDLYGRKILTRVKSGKMLDISFLEDGIYVVECQQGGMVYRAGLIKVN